MAGRVFVLGIDGADFSLIKPWLESGKLPNLKKIMDKGSYGNLRSTIPPITGAAWSSFQTGTNPGKHGAFNWFKRKHDGYQAVPVNANDICEPTLWEILSKFQKKIGVIGVPVTYPLKKVNGFMIPGLLTTKNSKRQSYPEDLINKVRKIVPDFKFSPKEWTRGYKIGEWINEMKQDIKNKTRITTKLMKENIWDFMMVHFMETDQVQHFMWDQKQNENNQSILEIYQSLDHTIAKIQAELSQEDTLFIMSDHGFGSLHYNFHIDTWLLKEGYIKLKNNLSSLLKKIGFKMGITKETLYPVGEYIYPWLRKEGILETALDVVSNPWLQRLFLASQNVNWSQSQAYSHSEIGSIYLNVKGREPQGCVEPGDIDQVREEIIGKLKELENPFTGKKISSQVYKGEEVYHGSQSIYAPDIVFLPDNMEILGKGAYQFLSNKIVSKSESQSGHHRMDGIFLAQGPGINQGHEITASHIMDMAPTILYQLGLPNLDHMDGTVIKDIYEEDLEEEIEQVSKSDLGLRTKKRNSDGKSEDDEDKKKRLKGLGYVS